MFMLEDYLHGLGVVPCRDMLAHAFDGTIFEAASSSRIELRVRPKEAEYYVQLQL